MKEAAYDTLVEVFKLNWLKVCWHRLVLTRC